MKQELTDLFSISLLCFSIVLLCKDGRVHVCSTLIKRVSRFCFSRSADLHLAFLTVKTRSVWMVRCWIIYSTDLLKKQNHSGTKTTRVACSFICNKETGNIVSQMYVTQDYNSCNQIWWFYYICVLLPK